MRGRCAVLGRPIAHSLSPVLHRAGYDALGLDWSYDALECDAEGLEAMLDLLAADPDWAGVSLTMPLKTAVLPLLDEMSALARSLGAVNTVVLRSEASGGGGGRRSGHNTDVAGVLNALAELGPDAVGGPALVLGGGGAARAVLAGLGRLGVPAATVVVRDPAAVEALTHLGARVGVPVELRPWSEAAALLAGARSLVVATTPAGTTDALVPAGWPRGTALFEVLYDPWPTPLAAAAMAAGAPVVGGLAMLVGQAVEAFELLTGRPAPAQRMREAGQRALALRRRPGDA